MDARRGGHHGGGARAGRARAAVNRPVISHLGAGLPAGYGVVWLSVRGQRPFHAPEGWALALLALLAVLAWVSPPE